MIASPQSDFLRALYQTWSDRMAANPGMTISDLRSLFDEWHQPTLEPEEVTYKSDVLAGVEGVWAIPHGANSRKVILYTHGGGFAVGSSASHRKLAGHLAKHLGITAIAIDYRRAPEHPFPAQIDDAVAVYKELLARGFAAADIVTSGDSAGGNLAIATVLKLRQDGTALPGAVIAFSPWLDMENNSETLKTNLATDALITTPLLEGMIAGVLGEQTSPTEPLINPLYANYSGYPRMYLCAGSAECLLDNATRLAARAQADGVDVTLSIVDGMQHVFPCLAGRAPEADDELRRIAMWFKSAGSGVSAGAPALATYTE